jgi:2-octaprenyl-6-methoxyphenol hydroxylase
MPKKIQSTQISDAIVIVGGGPVGATLALLLGQQNKPVIMLEARAKGAAYQESRALALSYGSRKILEKLGVWQPLAAHATAINHIHVSQQGSLGRSLLKAEDYKQAALGYVVSYGALSQALDDCLKDLSSVTVQYESSAQSIAHNAEFSSVNFTQKNLEKKLESRLVVLADGGRSLDDIAGLTKETKEYGHDALISKVSAELPHNNIAYERFTPNGPIALLPNGERDFSLVWTGNKDYVAPLLNLSDAEFLVQFHDAFGDRVGKFLTVKKRMTFPLKLSKLVGTELQHLVVIGNAAQTMHPVAGQGFNVGLRDAESLAKYILSTREEDLGSEKMLADYRQSRAQDTKNGLMFTDFLVNIFTNDLIGMTKLRSLGLGVFDLMKPAKRFLVRKMSFGR